VIANDSEKHSYRELLTLFRLDNQLSVKDYRPVTATVVAKSPNVWYSTVTIDKGESSDVHVNDPVINGEGLVGKVAQAASDGAQVTLITDSSVGVSARIGTSGATGIVQPKVGDPNDLLLQYLPANTQANKGEYVVTSGTVSSPDDSLYPPGIPIGQVTSINEESAYRSVNVHPLANLHNLDVVQVLTAARGSLPANLSRIVAALPPGQQGSSAEQLASTGGG
jgi:rod shape-determining protein MreC